MRASRRVFPAGKRVKLTTATTGLVVLMAAASHSAPAQAPEPSGAAAWRVECSGDGKALECRAVQQVFQRETRQLVLSAVCSTRRSRQRSPTSRSASGFSLRARSRLERR